MAFTPVSMELFFQLQAIGSRTFQVFPVLVAAVLWYLAIRTVLMVVQYYVERHYSRGYGQARRTRSRVRGIEAEHGGGITIAPAADEGSGGAT